jgi:hypothetical protein
MQIIDIQTTKSCLDKSSVKIVTVNESITRNTLKLFREFGDLHVYELLNPLFIVRNPYHWEIKGLLNERKFKIIMYQDEWAEILIKFMRLFSSAF